MGDITKRLSGVPHDDLAPSSVETVRARVRHRRYAQRWTAGAGLAVLLAAIAVMPGLQPRGGESGNDGPPTTTQAPVTLVPTPEAPGAVTIMEVMVDGPWYADIGELAAAADLVVQVRIEGTEVTMSYPDTSIYSSDDPHLNPYAGTGHTPSAAEIEAMGTVETVNTAVVVDVVAGSAEVGELVRVWEMGGTMAGIETRVHGTVPLAELDGDLILFLERRTGHQAADSDYNVVGSSQGVLRSTDGVSFISVAPDRTDLVLGPTDWAAVATVVDG